MTIEGKFNHDHIQSSKATDFISNWLLLKDDNDDEHSSTDPIFRLAQVYTTFEYEQNEISLIYLACRIFDDFKENTFDYVEWCQNEHATRSSVRDEFFRILFERLWTNLIDLFSNEKKNTIEQWTYMYTFIDKYYPSNTVLRSTKLTQIANQIEFMRLAYAIFLNENILEPIELLHHLLVHLPRDQLRSSINNSQRLTFVKLIPDILNTIFEHKQIDECTLMIDIQQWLISILRTSKQRSQDDINNVFISLGDLKCRWSMPMKQLLFDELIDLTILQSQKQILSIIDRIEYLLPIIIQCIPDKNSMANYQIPHHPFVLQQNRGHRIVLLDLFFFHLDQYLIETSINEQLINEFMTFKPPKINDPEVTLWMKIIFKDFREYFLIRSTALYLSEVKFNDNENDADEFIECFKVLITNYLLIDETTVQLSDHLQIFLSTIVVKRSWSFLLNFLKLNRIQHLNMQWATILYNHLKLKHESQSNSYLQFAHQLQFTLSAQSHIASIFPHLHQLYDELNQIIITCVNDETNNTRWQALSDWILLQSKAHLTDMKVLLLLNIYYNYYCHNRLQLLNSLINVIETTLEPTIEELCVFRCLLDPEHYIIGYSMETNNTDLNHLTRLFRLDCQAVDELYTRHLLVNLMAMILMSGKKSFLWTFAFQPLAIENTFGIFEFIV